MAIKSKSTLLVVGMSAAVQKLGGTGLAVAVKASSDADAIMNTARTDAFNGLLVDGKAFYDYVKQSGGISVNDGNITGQKTVIGLQMVKKLSGQQYGEQTERLFGRGTVYASYYAAAFAYAAGWIDDKGIKAVRETLVNVKTGTTAVNALLNKAVGKAETVKTEKKKPKAAFSAWLGAVNKTKKTGLYTKTEFLNWVKAQLEAVETNMA